MYVLLNPIRVVLCIAKNERKTVVSLNRAFYGNTMKNQIYEDHLLGKVSGTVSEEDKVAKYDFRSMKSAREIVDIGKLLKNKIATNDVFCSFEFFPVKNDDVYQRFFTEMNKYNPLFYALTWHAKNDFNSYLSLELVEKFPSNTLLHLAVNNMNHDEVDNILKKALDFGITNICALRGDASAKNGNFPYAVDLVNFIRNRFGNKFSIGVAGYPEMHPESPSKDLDLFYLKAKVDAGADFIITQIFFEAEVFINFVKDCRKIGINVPIIPGIFPINNYKSLEKITKFCKVKVPQKILDHLQTIIDNDEAINKYGIDLAIHIINSIFESRTAHGFHLFTLNRLSLSKEICDRTGIFEELSKN